MANGVYARAAQAESTSSFASAGALLVATVAGLLHSKAKSASENLPGTKQS
jgi:hypothetical protein